MEAERTIEKPIRAAEIIGALSLATDSVSLLRARARDPVRPVYAAGCNARLQRWGGAIAARPDQVWVIFDWDGAGWQSFATDPEVPGIMRRPGTRAGRRWRELGGRYDA